MLSVTIYLRTVEDIQTFSSTLSLLSSVVQSFPHSVMAAQQSQDAKESIILLTVAVKANYPEAAAGAPDH